MPALKLNEAETSFQAVVDPYARADFFLSASPEGLEVEEGFVTFPTLPGGLLMKVGKMKAQFGKVNTMHSHVLPWVDEPLAMRNLLGGDEGLNDSGISVSKLIMNPVLFLEATGEVYNGENDVFRSYKRSDLTYVGRLRGYRDVTEGTNLDLGTSFAYGHNDADPRRRRSCSASTPRSAIARCSSRFTSALCCGRSCSGAAASSRSVTRKPSGRM